MAVQPDGGIVVGGNFGQVGQGLARVHGGTEAPNPPAIIEQPSNQSVIEGQPASLGIWVRSFVPPAYQWQRNEQDIPGATNATLSFHPARGSDAAMYRVIASNTMGSVTSIVARLSVYAAPSGPGAVDTTFITDPGPDDYVEHMVRQLDGRILISGAFTWVDGVPRSQIARLNPDGTLDPSFDAGSGPRPPSGISWTPPKLFLQGDGRILVPGSFEAFNGQPRYGLVRLEADGRIDETFNPTDLRHKRLFALQQDDRMLVYGNGLQRLNPDGTWDSCFKVRLAITGQWNDLRFVLQQSDGRLLLGGEFDDMSSVLRVNLDGSFDSYRGQGGTRVAALQPDDKLLLLWRRPGLLRLNRDGTRDDSFTGEIVGFENNDSAEVSALAFDEGGKILVGGAFKTKPDGPRLSVARLHGDGRFDASFSAVSVSPFNYTVKALAMAGPGKILVGGSFTEVNGFPRNRIAQLHAGELPGPATINIHPEDQSAIPGQNVAFKAWASSASPMSYQWLRNGVELPGATNSVLTLRDVDPSASGQYQLVIRNSSGSIALESDGDVIGASLGGLGRVKPDGSSDPTFAASFPRNARIRTWAVQPKNNQVIVAYSYVDFTVSHPVIIDRIERLQTNGLPDSSFSSTLSFTNREITSLLVQRDGGILIGRAPGFQGPGGWARVHADGSPDSSFDSAVGGWATAMVEQRDGKILVVGELTTIQTKAQGRIARIHPGGHLDFIVPLEAGPDALVSTLDLDADDRIWIGGSFTKVGRFPRSGIARLYGFSSPSLELGSAGFDGQTFSVSAKTIDGRRCFLEYKEALTDSQWIALPPVQGDGTLKLFSDPTPSSGQRFYRIRAE